MSVTEAPAKSPSLTTNFFMFDDPNATASAISRPACTAVTRVLLSTAEEIAGAGADGPVTIAAALAVGAAAGAADASELAAGEVAAGAVPVSPLVDSASSAGCALTTNADKIR